ncbi:MAG: hypothetical protein Q9174_005259, partial [Haloplaca sp. 1 TL-2023]
MADNMSSLFLLLSFLSTLLSQTILAAPSTAPYQVQPNGAICSEGFGAVVADDCVKALAAFPVQEGKKWYEFALTPSEDEGVVVLPWDNTVGTCAITVNISPGAKNLLTSATITTLAQDILTTCPTLAGSPGGWGLYADTFLTFTSTTDPSPQHSANLSATPEEGEGGLRTDPQAYFLRSFWYGGETGGVNITDLPGYPETLTRIFPPETYAPYSPEEKAFCGPAEQGTTCQANTDCCENATCMNRVGGDGQSIAKVCVPPGGEVVKPATVTTEGDTVVIKANNRRVRKRGQRLGEQDVINGERTVLSESEEENLDPLVDHKSAISGSTKDSANGTSITALLANIWQFLLGRNALELRRLYPYNFLPAETVTNIAEGTSYRVSKGKLVVASQQVVAIKHIKIPHLAPQDKTSSLGEQTLETVLRELRVLAHKPVRKNVNVAQLIGYGAEEVQGHLAIYLVADFASGGTLKEFLAEHNDVSSLDCTHFCYDISSGLAGLHACGIVQGDLKLANILVFADQDGFVAKLSDFGCSIFEENPVYTGSLIYNAPEVRRGRLGGFGTEVDGYATDVFSLGLVVWETLQGGRPFIQPSLEVNQILWLNGLPKDDLLLQALQTFETLPIPNAFPKRVIRGVLEGCLRDEPKLRPKCPAIVQIFRSDRIFSNSQRNTSSYINPSKIPPLEKWSFTRADNLAATVPGPLQTELFSRLKRDVDENAGNNVDFAYFHLAMCHLTGFGTSVSQDKFLESLVRGAASGEVYSCGLYLRMHRALQTPMDATVTTSDPIVQIEEDLQKLPAEDYYSHRIREHERALQRRLLHTPFDLCLQSEVLKKDAVFKAKMTSLT